MPEPSLLAQVPFLASLGEDQLRALAEKCRRRAFKPHEVLFHEGDPGDALFILQAGHVKILRVAANGEERILRVHGPGDCLGELALVDGAPRSAKAEALEPVEALVLHRDEFLHLIRHSPSAALAVCARLDGIPLAIELAAARLKVLAVEPIDWSYDLLSEAERKLLRRLSVFVGGWTLEAAEAVCAGEGIAEEEVLDQLSHLVDKSLVLVEGQGGPAWYRLLETIRQYGREKLHASAETEAVRTRHRDRYLQLAEQAEPQLHGRDQAAWIERLEREHDNLRAALDWSVESAATEATVEGAGHRGERKPLRESPVDGGRDSAEAGLQLGGALGQFWAVRGYLSEGRERLAALLALSPPEAAERENRPATAARAKARKAAGVLAYEQGDYAAAGAHYQEGDGPWIGSETGPAAGWGASFWSSG
jgi:CRP-like cAMP-binding protein